MDSRKYLDLLDRAQTQYRWAIANIAVAGLCAVVAAAAFMFGYLASGLLTLAVSLAAVWNADALKKRGDMFSAKAERNKRLVSGNAA